MESPDEWRVAHRVRNQLRGRRVPWDRLDPDEEPIDAVCCEGFETSHTIHVASARHHGKWTWGREQSSYGKDTDRVVA